MLMLLLACTGPDVDSSPGEPSLALLSPAEGDVVCGAPLHIETKVESFVLTEETDLSNPDPNQGHIHLYLNGVEISTSYEEVFDVPDVIEGEKQMRVELGLTNHETLEPYVGTTIYITVDNTACSG